MPKSSPKTSTGSQLVIVRTRKHRSTVRPSLVDNLILLPVNILAHLSGMLLAGVRLAAETVIDAQTNLVERATALIEAPPQPKRRSRRGIAVSRSMRIAA